MKKILVIDESPLFREFLHQKLTGFGFEVILGTNGLDASLKLRSSLPDLIIMDYYLSRKSCLELLAEKKDNPNTAAIPIIMASSKIDREKLVDVAKYGVKKFFTKPVRVDALLKTVSDLLKVGVDIDNSPCIIEAHVNEDILFIEVAQGLNKEKIELLKYKITELLELYEVSVPKVLILMSSVDLTSEDSIKLNVFLSTVLDSTHARARHVKILTNSEFVRAHVLGRPDFADIEVTNNLERAMETLMKRDAASAGDSAQAKVTGATAPRKDKQESIQLRFEGERAPAPELSDFGDSLKIAVVDDDMIIQELVKTAFSDTRFTVVTFDNGSLFVQSKAVETFDIVFLDLMMPVMDGFATLEELKKRQLALPIIVLSAITQRETVVKALAYGVKSYLTKPLKPELVRKKATEILRMNF